MLTPVADPRTACLAALARGAGTSSSDYLRLARRTLEDLMARDDLLAGITLQRKPGGYARTLLLGENGISVWAITWSPGSRTSVHDHHCSCCFGVWSGALREVWFRALNETDAVATGEALREPGSVACMMPSDRTCTRWSMPGRTRRSRSTSTASIPRSAPPRSSANTASSPAEPPSRHVDRRHGRRVLHLLHRDGGGEVREFEPRGQALVHGVVGLDIRHDDAQEIVDLPGEAPRADDLGSRPPSCGTPPTIRPYAGAPSRPRRP